MLALDRLIRSLSMFEGNWHWGYQILFGDVINLSQPWSAAAATNSRLSGKNTTSNILRDLFTAYPEIAAEYFFKTFIRLAPTLQEVCI
jgi:hypothetical protein